ncbi:helix-turn-helix domain-containing protein [Phenylobacterium sp.]|uniref:TetR/AcrR family transcriptional regulator n=1 Tax=Phenylobacterium sp. TaxID=1871053 RepID=UPI00301D517A
MSVGRRYHVGDLPGRLIREARAMLEEGDLKQFNLRALASRAGITTGSMYHHYESKAALLGELAAIGFGELRRSLDQGDQAAAEGVRLRAWATGYFAFAGREPAMFALMFDPEVADLPRVAGARGEVLSVLRRTVVEVAEVLGRENPPVDKITLAVWAAAHGAASLAGPAGDPELIEDVIAGLEALFRPQAA